MKALVREAATLSINRVFSKEASEEALTNQENLDGLFIEEQDFLNAIPKVQPSGRNSHCWHLKKKVLAQRNRCSILRKLVRSLMSWGADRPGAFSLL